MYDMEEIVLQNEQACPVKEIVDDTERIKTNLAQNILRLRKEAGLTQAELADKLNYSDKSVSKWERGEAIPDIATLKNISVYFGTTIDNLISVADESEVAVKKPPNTQVKKIIICACSTILVWLVAVFAYSFMNIIYPPLLEKAWLCFIAALPATFIVNLVFSAIWGRTLTTALVSSFLIWTAILTVYMFLASFLVSIPETIWMIFLIGIPLQVLVILWFTLRKIK